VDLRYVNRKRGDIARRHARIVGRGGKHTIEDLGSTAGTMVNWRTLPIGHKLELSPGDRVSLGLREFVYSAATKLRISTDFVPHGYLWVTFTGHRFFLPRRGEVVIGRSDISVGFNPDIDLSQEGNAATHVARRHARITIRNNRHYVDNLGSASGTKLNGVPVRIGQFHLLHPGYHLWLGGCVLTYDIETWSGSRCLG
jgi:pSer/pThr/pTyr-binding forkhead associated (FHA) protein